MEIEALKSLIRNNNEEIMALQEGMERLLVERDDLHRIVGEKDKKIADLIQVAHDRDLNNREACKELIRLNSIQSNYSVRSRE